MRVLTWSPGEFRSKSNTRRLRKSRRESALSRSARATLSRRLFPQPCCRSAALTQVWTPTPTPSQHRFPQPASTRPAPLYRLARARKWCYGGYPTMECELKGSINTALLLPGCQDEGFFFFWQSRWCVSEPALIAGFWSCFPQHLGNAALCAV